MHKVQSLLEVQRTGVFDSLQVPERRVLGDLRNQVVVVLGGTGVIGTAVVEELFRHGAGVAVVSRTAEKVEALAQSLSKTRAEFVGENTGLFPFIAEGGDATSEASLARIANRIKENFGKITSLVCLVGGNRDGTKVPADKNPLDVPYDEILKTFELNFRDGFYNPIKAIVPIMLDGLKEHDQKISIVSTSSMAALTPLSVVGAYGMAKAAMANYATWLAGELGTRHGDRVRINCVTPGFVIGEQNRKLLIKPDGQPTPRGEKILAHTSFKRFGDAKEMGPAYVALLSDGFGFVTGQEIIVDGGFSSRTI